MNRFWIGAWGDTGYRLTSRVGLVASLVRDASTGNVADGIEEYRGWVADLCEKSAFPEGVHEQCCLRVAPDCGIGV